VTPQGPFSDVIAECPLLLAPPPSRDGERCSGVPRSAIFILIVLTMSGVIFVQFVTQYRIVYPESRCVGDCGHYEGLGVGVRGQTRAVRPVACTERPRDQESRA